MTKSASFLPRLAALLCAAVLLLVTIPGQAEQPLQALHKHVRPAVARGQAVPVGLLPSTQRLNLAIMLPLRNQDELTSLLGRLYDPSSPDYHQFLSVAQFTERFSPTEQDYQAVVQFAEANGLTVTDTPPNRLLVDVSGSVAQIQKAFHVVIRLYQHPTENRTFYSPDREPSLDLSVPVAHIAGLNNYSIPHPMLKRSEVGQQIHRNAGSGPDGSYLASDMRAAYYGGSTLTGSGQAVGLVEFDGYNLSDVTSSFYGHQYNVPIKNVLLDGASAGSDGNDAEQVLDIVQAIGMAPGLSQVRVYIAPITTSIGVGDVDIFNKMATENIAKQLSCSWGWDPDDHTQNDPIFQEFAVQGQNLFVASGDYGAYFGKNFLDYSFPAEDVYVTAVGGTDLTTSGPGGSWQSEIGWGYSGGGPADDGFAIPSWQVGVANSYNKASSTIRNVPDVAAEANFDNYACNQGVCQAGYGGTSFAAPRWAGFLALINQQAVANSKQPLGFINPAIYSIGFGAGYNSGFHDITSVDYYEYNHSYPAVVGYDMATGWGSPNGQSLINVLGSPSFTLSTSPNNLTITQGAAGGASTITVNSLVGFTGSVSLTASGLPPGVIASFNPPSTTTTSTLTLTANSIGTTGTTIVTITGTSGSLTATTKLILTVNPTFTISASPYSLSVPRGSKGTSTITVTSNNNFSSPTTLRAGGLPGGVTATFSPNPVTPPPNSYVTSTLTFTASPTATVGTSTVTVTGTSGSVIHYTPIALTIPSSPGQIAVYNSTLMAPECATVGTSCDSGPSLLLGRDHIAGGAEPHQPNTIYNSCPDGPDGIFHGNFGPESNDRIVVYSNSGGPLTHGTTATISATVWADQLQYSSDALDLYYAADATNPVWVFIGTIVPTKGGGQDLSATFTLPSGNLQAVRAQFRYLGSASPCSIGAFTDHDDLIFAVQ
jgi:hypothetical protein